MTTITKPHQIVGTDFLVKKHRCILADDMGLGKTKQVIDAIHRLGTTQNLIVCPKSAKAVWKREILQWYPGATEKDILVVGEQPFEIRERLLKTKSLFTIINYTHIGTISERDKENKKIVTTIHQMHVPTLLKVIWGSVTFDEAHKLRNRKSKAFDTAKKICTYKENLTMPVFAVTGTPVYNKPMDIWPLLNIINPKKYGSYWRFAQEECEVIRVQEYGVPVHNVIGPVKDPAGLKKRLSDVMIRREKRDVLDLPPISYIYVPLELSEVQRKAYDKMVSMMFTEWHGKEVEAVTVLAQLTRLKQMCLSPDLMPEHEGITGVKIEWLLDMCENLDEKASIFSQWSTAIKRVVPKLKHFGGVATFTGETNYNLRNYAIDDMQTKEHYRFLATTTQCGESYTVTAVSTCIFLDLMWSPATNAQAVARMDRMGQTRPMTVYVPYTVDTVEEYILDVLRQKEEMFDSIIPVYRVADVAVKVWQSMFSSHKINQAA